jgi:long-chain fatty acid transport protein
VKVNINTLSELLKFQCFLVDGPYNELLSFTEVVQVSAFQWLGMTLIGVLCGAVTTASGAGFSVFTQGAKALGQANAVIAHSESPSTLFYNPAMMNDLPGTQVEIGTTLVYDDREFHSDLTGASTDGESHAKFPSTLYLTHAVNDRWSLGLAVFHPFGLGTEWPGDWEGRFLATKTQLTTYVFNPIVSFRLTPRVSVAVGVSYMLLDAKLERKLNLSLLGPFGEANEEFSVTGDAWGFNVGLLVKLTDRLHLGLSYRSAYDATLDGKVKHHLPATAAPIASLFPDTDVRVDLNLPDQFLAGIAYHVTTQLVVEAAFRWEGWSRNEELRIKLDDAVAMRTSQALARDWHNAYGFLFGAQYRLNPGWLLMAGYLYENNPIPNRTFEPSNPDANTHVFSVGTSVRVKAFEATLAYALQHETSRHKDNDIGADTGFPANGTYKSTLHLVALSLGYRF